MSRKSQRASSALPTLVSPAVPLQERIVTQIPTNHNMHEMPYPDTKECISVVIRECQQNANSFGATNAFFIRFSIDNPTNPDDASDKFTGLIYMSDARPFASVAEIMELALVPNRSAQQQGSLHGSGLTYTASYLNSMRPELVVASVIDGKIVAARGYANYQSNEWVIEESREWAAALHAALGEQMLGRNKVFYVFRIKKVGSSAKENLNMSFVSTLTFIAPDIVHSPALRFGEPVWSPTDKHPTLSSIVKSGGWAKREVISIAEYNERYAEYSDEDDGGPLDSLGRFSNSFTNEVVVKIQDEEWLLRTKVEMFLYKGLPTTSTDAKQWFASVRNSPEGWVRMGSGFITWTADSGSTPGAKPKSTAYLRLPALASANDKYSRLGRQSVFSCDNNSRFLDNMGIYAEDYGSSASTTGSAKPYCLLFIDVVEVLGRRPKGTEAWRPVDPIELIVACGRRADFLIDKNIGRDIVEETTKAGASLVPQRVRDWFESNFHRPTGSLCPIRLDLNTAGTHKGYEAINLETGNFHDRKFRLARTHFLVFRNKQTGRFIDDISEHPNTRGVVITKLNPQSFEAVIGQLSPTVSETYKKLKEENGLTSIPVYSIKVSELLKIDGETEVPATEDEYLEAIHSGNSMLFMPSGKIRCKSPTLIRDMDIGAVMGVPKDTTKKPTGRPRKMTGHGTRPGDRAAGTTNVYYEDERTERLGKWNRHARYWMINIKCPLNRPFVTGPHSVEEQHLLNSLHEVYNNIAHATFKVSQFYNVNHDKIYDAHGDLYDQYDAMDSMSNECIKNIMSCSLVAEIFLKLERMRPETPPSQEAV